MRILGKLWLKLADNKKSPILFLIFNRPEETRSVFDEIRKYKPSHLYIAADGPRAGRGNEVLQCNEARQVVDLIDWPCETQTLFRDENLGCKTAVSQAISWFFECEEAGIILEDDCLPNHSFFIFCQEMLEKYRSHPEVGMIAGVNFQMGERRGDGDYYFSKYMHIWGWATWSDRWQNSYDVDIRAWPSFRKSQDFLEITKSRSNRSYWETIFERVYRGKIDTWDYQWLFANWLHKRFSIIPNSNLISNIGFGEGATHTKIESQLSNLPVQDLAFPLAHPNLIKVDESADLFTENNYFSMSVFDLLKKVKNKFSGGFK